jgi:hypothetical protein
VVLVEVHPQTATIPIEDLVVQVQVKVVETGLQDKTNKAETDLQDRINKVVVTDLQDKIKPQDKIRVTYLPGKDLDKEIKTEDQVIPTIIALDILTDKFLVR